MTQPLSMSHPAWDVLDAELIDTLQKDRSKRRLPLNVRTIETRSVWPLAISRARPTLRCAYCGRPRCIEHSDLPKLDPYYNGGK